MPALSRNIGESFKVTDDVEVTILSVQGNQVKLGISAPRNVEVHREEVYRRIHANSRLHANGKTGR